jgi:hypothetical protein
MLQNDLKFMNTMSVWDLGIEARRSPSVDGGEKIEGVWVTIFSAKTRGSLV